MIIQLILPEFFSDDEFYLSPHHNFIRCIYSIFLICWSCVFSETWDKESGKLQYQWGIEGTKDTNQPRPEYKAP